VEGGVDGGESAARESRVREGRAERVGAVGAACLDQINAQTIRGVPFTVPAVALLALILGDTVSSTRKWIWITVMGAAVVFALASSLAYARRRRAGPIRRWWPGLAGAAFIGAAWGSVAWIAMPGPDHGDLQVIILLFCLGSSATGIVEAAASRPHFYAYQVPLMATLTTVFLLQDSGTSRLLGAAIPLYLVCIASLHHEVHRVVTSEMELKHEMAQANDSLSELARRDGLTGLLNRRAFAEELDNALAAARGTGELVGLVYLDLDRFKGINDRLGHLAGDHVLVQAAARLSGLARAGDRCGRLGGDEFGLLARELNDAAELQHIADDVCRALAEPIDLAGQRVVVAASVGYALRDPHRPGAAAAFLSDSDTAQYRAKQLGGNRVIPFDEHMHSLLQARVAAETELRSALARQELVSWYQPIIDLATGGVVGAEALARWHHPARGLLPAGEFIDTARAAGLLEQLDEQLMRQTFAARVTLRSNGAGDEFRMWMNVAGSWLSRRDGRARVEAVFDRTGCRPEEIGIEITESEVLHDLAFAAEILTVAREAGIRIALDDFGTGHSSLTLLRRLPIDIVKIDRSFVQNIVTCRADRAIVAGAINLAHDLGLCVVAEGVETEAHRDLLASLACDQAQGYLFARPMPLDLLRRSMSSLVRT
jgi:diguanylate cyclase (GGDEF)-like protein